VTTARDGCHAITTPESLSFEIKLDTTTQSTTFRTYVYVVDRIKANPISKCYCIPM